MKGTAWVVFAVSCAPFLYVAGVLFAGLPPYELTVVVLAYLATVGLGVYYLSPRWAGEVVAPILLAGLSLFFLASAADPFAFGGVAADVSVGIAAAAPLVLLLVSAHPDRGPGGRLVALQVALLDGLAMLAVREYFMPGGTSVSGPNLLAGYLSTIHAQLEGLGTVVSGGSSAALPLASVNNPIFVLLAGLALVVTVISVVRPMTGRGVALPTVPRGVPGPLPSGAEAPGIPPSFRDVLRSRSSPDGPPKGEFPALPSLLGAFGAAAVFVALLYAALAWTLLLTALGALVGVAILVALLFRPLGARRHRWWSRKPDEPMPEASRKASEL